MGGLSTGGTTNGGTKTSGNSHDTTISATAEGVVFDRSKNDSGPGAGPVAPAGNWSPPPCWLAPEYTQTGFHYNHHRYYDPTTAHYLTPDPLGLTPAPNPTTYPDNPHTWTDPLGLSPCTVYHYTDEKGLQGILDSKEIWHSSGNAHARFGDGQYFTDIAPDAVKGLKKVDLTPGDIAAGKISRYQLVRRLFGRPTRWGLGKTTHYIEIDVHDLAIGQGRPGVFYYLNDGPLEIANRIVRYGRTPS